MIVGFLTFSPKVPNKYLLLISLKLYLRVSNPGSLFDIQKHEDFYEKFIEECLEIDKESYLANKISTIFMNFLEKNPEFPYSEVKPL